MGTVLVTGGGRGIGAAVVRDLGARGHHVIVNYRRDGPAADAVVDEVRRAGGGAEAVRADVTDPDEVAEMLALVVQRRGGVDALVVNANTAPPPFAPLTSLGWDAFASKITGELAGAFHVTQQVLPLMRARGQGRIVYVGSTAADYVGGGRLAHGTAKAALATFARHVAAESARDGITVLTVAPGAVRGPATEALPADRHAELDDASVLGRMVEPRDVAAAVAVLLGPELRIATGSTVRLDAGWSVLVGGPSAV
ncbi:SDR family oxidoreductase [Pseudonocardia endophytica]|uniref:3-oxoacyl-[acyl-carrier protein] reductase n=1 Tax=Pseudonocardia endophytica TaxID=401976 RepID=A0A4R1HP43_PSEEN|nr:SDR family oxidoreductase [Pseudonocardia endophytica]TCK22160.1 3-oxoacyl-[acyl-carrier protein] reductase [Pseudonocardia endophytica]